MWTSNIKLRIALAQINPTVGDLAGNRHKIMDYLEKARRLEVDVLAFPEMVISGYPPEDLLLKPDFVEASMHILQEIVTASQGLTTILGCVYVDDDLYNAAAIIHNGSLAGVQYKTCLPNYGVFDENRYFKTGQQQQVIRLGEVIFGVSICEDIWYPDGPPEKQANHGGATILLNISASPYHQGKGFNRERMLATRAIDNIAFVAYCNLVGGQDELVFDGQSLICSPTGEVIARAKQFQEELLVSDLDLRQSFRGRLFDPRRRQIQNINNDFHYLDLSVADNKKNNNIIAAAVADLLEEEAEIYQALVLGTRDYVRKNGFREVVLGLSGGVDSSLTATIAADALGPQNVTGVAMPSRYSSDHSLEDAETMARNLGIKYLVVPIDRAFQSFLDMLEPIFAGREADLAEENVQPRIRGTLLMALSNKFGSLVLATGNKSEVGVGYSTLYGDTAGGFAVIKDVPKTLVYRLSNYRNSVAGKELIPPRVLEKPPSAELKPGQRDTDSLPAYPELDPILHAYVEESCSLTDFLSRGRPEEMVRQVISMVDRNEYKRRQSPPGIKITPRAFGKDWRLPITNRFFGY